MKHLQFGLCLWLTLCPGLLLGQGEERAAYIRKNYTKVETEIPMRDGVKLFTAIYMPNDTSKDYPVLLYRTPYSLMPYGSDQYDGRIAPHEAFEKEGFIFVLQDVRGRFMSGGEFAEVRPQVPVKHSDADVDESTDAYDTIDWIINNVPHHNHRVGQWGISYPGFYSAAAAIDSHPALKAVSPQAPIADFCWDDVFHNGAFLLPHIFWFQNMMGPKRTEKVDEWPDSISKLEATDAYKFFMDVGPLKNLNTQYLKDQSEFWNLVIQHPNYDEFWQERNLLPHLKNVNSAVMTVGGWYDREDLYGPLHVYQAIERNNPDADNRLVMGPWPHGGWLRSKGDELGDASFGFSTSTYFQEHMDLEFFKHYLKGAEDDELNLPKALVFETGANRWRQFDQWPPAQVKKQSFYFQKDGGLSGERPNESPKTCDSFVSDPAKPVPHSVDFSQWLNKTFYCEDQRFASCRPDVLVYESDILEQDVTLAGPIDVKLYVSTTGTDADWIVKVIDVFPDDHPDKPAQHRLVRADVFRGRFRESFTTPKPFVPGQVAEVSFSLWDVLHDFKRGHRLMIHVQSTWFPFIDRNPQTYVPNIFEADEEDFVKATHRLYRSKAFSSHIEAAVLQQMF